MYTIIDSVLLSLASVLVLYFLLVRPISKRNAASGIATPETRRQTLLQFMVFALRTTGIVFVVEVIAMLLLVVLHKLPSSLDPIVDATTVSLISAPLIYLWVVKPLYMNGESVQAYNLQANAKQLTKTFIAILLPSMVIFFVALLASRRLTMNTRLKSLKNTEWQFVIRQQSIINNNLNNIVSDLAFLSNQQVLTSIQDSLSDRGRQYLANDYLVFLSSRMIYDQIRFLDLGGMEVVRTNLNNGTPRAVPQDQLQSKKNRYYFTETIGLSKNVIYISPFDLNVEQGEIEQPLKPTIRFGTAVFNEVGEKCGALILNYRGENLLSELRNSRSRSENIFMLVNTAGYYLIGKDEDDEWGFMYDDKQDRTFGKDFPNAWEVIARSQSGHIDNAEGLFSFDTFHPPGLVLAQADEHKTLTDRLRTRADSHENDWKIISYIPPSSLASISKAQWDHLEFFYLLVSLFILIGSAALSFVLTTRRISQAALKANEANYRMMVNESISTIFSTDVQGKLTYVNPSVQTLTGYTFEELLHMKFTDLIRDDWKSKVMEFYVNQFEQQQEESSLEFPIITKSGEEKWVEQLASLLIDDQGKPSGFQSVVHDISARKQAEKDLLTAKQMAEEASQLKSEFLANMSHELRTPLNSVIGFSNILINNNKETLGKDDLNYLQRILANGEHLLSLINDVLDLSKIEAGRIDLEYVNDVSLPEMINKINEQMGGQVKDKPVDINVSMPEKVDLIRTDPAKLKQVIINLLSNAVKFTPEGGVTVRISTSIGTSIPTSIEVKDTGVGIPEDKLISIFDEFQQGDSSTTRQYGGTGLGLAISKSLCELMGYELTVDSKVGEGSTFTIILNTTDDTGKYSAGNMDTDTRRPETGTEDIYAALEGKRILVIDDDKDSRILIGQVLQNEGCSVLQARDGLEGFDVAQAELPDLILLDLRMQGTPGREVLS